MDQPERTTLQDTILTYHAIPDLADANLAPMDSAEDWDTAITFLQQEDRKGQDHHHTVSAVVVDGISEQD